MNPVKIGLLEVLLILAFYTAWLTIRPFWAEFLYFSSMTPYWLRQWILERFGASIGCCRHCGYNLKANESGVCPECGQSADPVTPVKEVERPPRLWSRWLVTTGTVTLIFIALAVTILLW